MKSIIIFCTFAFYKISHAREHCIPRVDTNGEKKYVGRVVSVDDRTWSAPTTFSATNMWAYFGWQGETNNRVTKYIELLMVEKHRPGFDWLRVNSKKDLYNLEDNCCFVEGGYGYKDGKKYVAYVARTFDSGVYYIGGLYMPLWDNKVVMHYMQGWETKYIEQNYAVLAYDCCTHNYCNSHDNQKFPCCRKSKNKRDALDYINSSGINSSLDMSTFTLLLP
ncbi:uncharacterized protein LOC123678156 isoform X2 [Harmonia axyridis]|uniref:uncharacterized protein LOC123678156 isoform X2 n=1 Tax=Harmonia axyridis TaxID=115357 RepID=UPI001E279255|nr:uncharacterized protein LOC123678156 isoform X2 [Harmonia axyridis]